MLIEPYCKEFLSDSPGSSIVLVYGEIVSFRLQQFPYSSLTRCHHLNSWASLEIAAGVRIELCRTPNCLNKSVIRWAWSHSLTESGASWGRLSCPWTLPSGWIWVSSSLFVPLHGRSSFSPLSAFSVSLHPLSLSVSRILCAWCSVLLSPSYSCMRRLSSEPESTLPPGGKG